MAEKYLYAAADSGCARAQFKLCLRYSQGLEVEANVEKAKSYFTLLSDPNHSEYLFMVDRRYRNIGYCYLHGLGVQSNREKALYYLQLASDLYDETAGEWLAELAKESLDSVGTDPRRRRKSNEGE
jgi:TPR repeat protein